MSLLVEAAPDGMPSSEVAAAVKSEPSNMSVHFRMMTMAGLVTSERKSRQIIYSANTDVLAEALTELSRRLGSRAGEGKQTKARKPASRRP